VNRSVLGCSLVVALTLGFAPAVRAQDQGNRRGGDRPSFADQIKDAVGLTDDQATKVKAIEEQVRAEIKKARDAAGDDWSAMREKMKTLTDKMHADVRALLDKDQQAKLDAWLKKEEEKRAAREAENNKPVNGHPDKEIVLPGGGGFDYLNADSASRKLYVAHSTRIDVIDMDKDEKIGEVEGVDGAHGTAIATAAKHGFATSGKKKKLIAFDLDTNKVLKEIDTGAGPDACLYASSVDEAWSINHKGGSVTCVDAKSLEVTKTIEIGGTLEFAAEIGDKVYVNVEDKSVIAAIDAKKHEVLGRYDVSPGEEPAGLAADPKNGLLFAGCHNQKLVVLEAATGKVLGNLPIGKGCDAVAFDAAASKVYVTCGDGTTTVILVKDAKTFEVVKTIETVRGGKTGAIDSKTHKLYIAAGPRRGEKGDAKVLVFNTESGNAD